MTTLEQVEKLRAMANVSYDEAKAALDAANGDLLEAIIALEKQGKVNAPTGGGYYSSEKTADPDVDASAVAYKTKCWEKHKKYCNGGETFTSFMKKIGIFCLKMIRKGTINSFEVLKGEESKASFPVIALALLLIFAFWVVIPLIIIGLFFGLRYRFNGPDFIGNTVNDAMNSAADAAENLKKSMND
ncbi:MAG: ubiquitin [Desulfitobacteriaceae bacterium]